jgi:shikimate dehydrogenase
LTRLLALLGDPVAHSLSPRIQNHALRVAGLDATYVALRTPVVAVEGLLRGIALTGGGGNVTLPHKARACAAVDRRTPAATRTGAVNTFWAEGDEVWGDNTDVEGLRRALGSLGVEGTSWAGSRVLLLGAGGAARAALLALEQEGVGSITIRSRRPEVAMALVESVMPDVEAISVESWDGEGLVDADLILHATPLGLEVDDPLPLDPNRVAPETHVMDLVYRPEQTRWVRALEARGIRALDGGEMLVGQGMAAFARWWGFAPPPGSFEEAFSRIRQEAVRQESGER